MKLDYPRIEKPVSSFVVESRLADGGPKTYAMIRSCHDDGLEERGESF